MPKMKWIGKRTRFPSSCLLFSIFSMVALYLIRRCQEFLPLNPHHFGPIPPDPAFNTAASYVTDTNWQAYE